MRADPPAPQRLPGQQPLVGRAGERKRIDALYSALATDGGGRGLVLLGGPGLGKTSLLTWACEAGARQGFTVGAVRPPGAGSVAGHQILAALIGSLGEEAGSEHAERASIAGRLRAGEAVSAFDLAEALDAAAGGAGLILAVDDLHAVPPDTVDLLISGARLTQRPVGFLGAARADEAPSGSIPSTSSDLPIDHLRLDAMGEEDVSELAHHLTGAPWTREAARRLYVLTRGNPMFVREIVRDLVERGVLGLISGKTTIEEDGYTPPRSLVAAIDERTRSLGEDAFAVACALGVSGAMSAEELVSVSKIDGARFTAALGVLVEADVVAEGPGHTWSVAHPLVSTALGEGLSVVERGAVSGRALDVLRARPAGTVSAVEVAGLALKVVPAPHDLVDLLGAAMDETWRAGTYGEARIWAQRTAEAASRNGDRQRLSSALEIGARAAEMHDPRSSLELFGKAVEAAPDPGRKALLRASRAQALRTVGQTDEALREVVSARASLPDDASPMDVRTVRQIHASMLLEFGEADAAEAVVVEMEAAGDPAAAGYRGHVLWLRGDLEGARDLSLKALADMVSPAHRAIELLSLAEYEEGLGAWDEAVSARERSIEGTRERGMSLVGAHVTAAHASLLARRGEHESAHACATDAWRLATKLGGANIVHVAAIGRAVAALCSGEPELVGRIFEEAAHAPGAIEAHVRASVSECSVRASIALGDNAAALRHLRVVEGIRLPTSLSDKATLLRAMIARAEGDAATAAEMLEPLVTSDPPKLVYSACEAAVVSADALLTLGRRKEAAERARVAAGRLAALGARPLHEHALSIAARAEASRLRRRPHPAGITERELEIVRLLAAGHSNAEIASFLVLSPATVKKHVENVLGKLQVQRRAQVAVAAARLGLLDPR